MAEVLGVAIVAKPKGRPKSSERDDVSVKMDRTLAAKARQVAIRRGITVAEFITEVTRPTIEREYAKLLRELDDSGC